jgi:hypothetical protein
MNRSGELNIQIKKTILILTEGITDKEFIEKIISERGEIRNKDIFEVLSAGNYEKTISTVNFIAANDDGSVLQQLGLVVDADEAPEERVTELTSLIASLNEKFETSFLMLPSASEAGALESLVLQSLDKASLACSDEYLSCVEKSAQLNTAQRDKLRLYAWTSQHQKEPVTNFMRVKADGQRVVDVHHAAFKPITDFLIGLENKLLQQT